MSITDELRGFIDGADGYELWCPRHKVELTVIADTIDATHESEVTKAGLHGYSMALQKVVNNYIKLPVDADGVPIRPGDELVIFDTGDHVRAYDIELYDDGRWRVCDDETMDSIHPDRLRHRAPTVEDVLDEFANAVLGCDNTEESVQRVIAEYAAKLRLAREVDE